MFIPISICLLLLIPIPIYRYLVSLSYECPVSVEPQFLRLSAIQYSVHSYCQLDSFVSIFHALSELAASPSHELSNLIVNKVGCITEVYLIISLKTRPKLQKEFKTSQQYKTLLNGVKSLKVVHHLCLYTSSKFQTRKSRIFLIKFQDCIL